MELGLSLGLHSTGNNNLGICMGLGSKSSPPSKSSDQDQDDYDDNRRKNRINQQDHDQEKFSSLDPSLQLHLLPAPRRTQPPPLRFPWLPADTLSSEPGSSDVNRQGGGGGGGAAEETEEHSSPNSGTSSFMEFSLYTSNNGGGEKGRRENGEKMGRTTRSNSRGSDDDQENGNGCNSSTRKKLRLSKEQSAFLEDNFKDHHTLNPKQKIELAKQLNLRPRQVEVWFQNRRARTKLKQTEVDCEYLKKCCETLTEENRRLQKELQELRALKTSQSQPFFMHLPPTTLTMCPSCERVAPTSSSSSAAIPTSTLSLGKPNKKKPILSQAQPHQPLPPT